MNTTTPTPADILNRAADLVKAGWTQHSLAIDAQGKNVDYRSADVVKVCLVGALDRAGFMLGSERFEPTHRAAEDLLNRALPDICIVSWNNDPARQQSEVVELLRKCAQRCSD